MPFAGDQAIFFSNLRNQSTPHPPGYLWMALISYLGKYILNKALIIRFVQALALALSLFSLKNIFKKNQLSPTIIIFIPLLWVFSFGVFRYFLIYENRALTFLMVCLFLLKLQGYLFKPTLKNKIFLDIIFVAAGVQHHFLYVLLGPCLLYAWSQNEKSWLKLIFTFGGLCILSIFPVLLLTYITQSHVENIFSWGDVQSFRGLWTHWSRVEFGTFTLARIESQMPIRAVFWHSYEVLLFLIKSTYGAVILCFIPNKNKSSHFEKSLNLGLYCFFLVLFIFGSIDPKDSWYHAILMRFWIIPSPLIFVLIAFKLQTYIEKFSNLKFIFPIVFMISVSLAIPNELKMANNPIYKVYSQIMAEGVPANSLVIHTFWPEWIRTVMSYNRDNFLNIRNSMNGSTHVLLKSIFDQGWSKKQLDFHLAKNNLSIDLNTEGSSLHSMILLVGPKNELELRQSSQILGADTEAIGPYFLITKQKKDLTSLRTQGLQLCERLMLEWLQHPVDQWIEPISDYFCYSCQLSYHKSFGVIPDEWVKMCKF